VRKDIFVSQNILFLTKVKDDGHATYYFDFSGVDNVHFTKSYRIKLSALEKKGSLINDELTELDKDEIFIKAREYAYHATPDFFEALGVNQRTVLDYLNLKDLGLTDYQNKLSALWGASRLTIRDRIAYARRSNWIPKVKRGTRKVEV
jgi:hypothetical protein